MDLDDTLTRLAELLDRHPDDSAAWLRAVLAQYAADETAGYAALNSKRMWGGAGSIANAALADNPGLGARQWETEVREFRALMIDLAEHLKSRGAHYPDIDFWLSAFTSWQQSNL
ncbi:MAG TPA: hypothetical protein VIR60_09320 [Gammaproteobacteria bacterium]